MRRTRSRAKVPLFLFLIAAAVGGCHRAPRAGDQEAAGQAPEPIVVGPEDASVVTPGPIETGPALSGTLTAKRQATVRALIGGSVLEVLAEPGQTVGAGQILARLDTTSLRDASQAAQAAVTTARSNLALAQRELERQRALAEAGIVAARNVESAAQSVMAARATLAQAQAQLSNANKQLGYTRVEAPFAGVVSDRPVSAGDVVQPGTALFTVVDPSSLQLEAAVPAESLELLRVGAPVEFTVTGYGGRFFHGEITRINPSADPATRQVRVYAEIPNAGRTLVAGLFAEGRVASQSRIGLTVPESAIDRRMAHPAVLRVRNDKVQRVEVELGLVDEHQQRVEIRRGVEAGDVVLLGAAQEIAPGTPVKLAPAVRQQAERLAQVL